MEKEVLFVLFIGSEDYIIWSNDHEDIGGSFGNHSENALVIAIFHMEFVRDL